MNAPVKLWATLNAEQRAETLRYRFKMGHNRVRIARDLGAAYSTITTWAESHGIAIPAPAPPANAKAAWLHLPADERRKVLADMLASGTHKSAASICAVLGCSKDALRKYAKKHDMELPNGRGFNLPAVNATRFGKPMPVSGGNVPARAPKVAVATRDIPVSYRPPAPAKRPPPDTPTRVHVLDHKSTQCRFPLWPDAGRTPFAEMFYCGAPREDERTSYCADCRRIIKRGNASTEDREALITHMHLMRRVRDRAKKG